MRKMPFQRLVREITNTMVNKQIRWQLKAVLALQEAAESYMVSERVLMPYLRSSKSTMSLVRCLLVSLMSTVLWAPAGAAV